MASLQAQNKNAQMKPVKLIKKHHMLKDRVGVVKTSTHKLPIDPSHEYGYRPPQDIEGTGDIMGNWVTANASLQKESQLSWINSNILAIQHGCVSAVEMRLYAEAHPNIRMKEVLNLGSSTSGCNHEGPFGIKTKIPENSMSSLIQANFTNFGTEDSDYPDTTNIMKLSSFPLPVATKASIALASCRSEERLKLEKKDKKFCMKKFQNIPGKISLPSPSKEAPAATNMTLRSRGSRSNSNSPCSPSLSASLGRSSPILAPLTLSPTAAAALRSSRSGSAMS